MITTCVYVVEELTISYRRTKYITIGKAHFFARSMILPSCFEKIMTMAIDTIYNDKAPDVN